MNTLKIEQQYNNPKYVNMSKLSQYSNPVFAELFRRYLAQYSMAHFMSYTYNNYKAAWYHKTICSKLDDWVEGKIKRLMIFTPPRCGKSALASERLPAYILGRRPQSNIIFASYGQDLANRMSRKVRECMRSLKYLRVFPHTTIGGVKYRLYKNQHNERFAVQEWETAQGGGQRSVGIGAGTTGYGCNYGIIDDPHKDRAEAESETKRQTTIDWYNTVFYTRLAPQARILIIQTRWHEEDLCGTLLKKAEEDPFADKWEIISLPAILEEPAENDYDIRKLGQALWPEWFSAEYLKTVRANLGIYNWSALYQQRPLPAGGGKIKREWFKIIDKAPEGLKWSRFYDLAVSTKSTADYTASIQGAMDIDGNIYLRNMLRGRWEWPDVYKMILHTSSLEKKTFVGVESNGPQKGFVDQLLRDKILRGISLKGFSMSVDKLTRALPWIARAEAGKIYLVQGDWIHEFLNECQLFTGHGDKHDDQVDSVSGCYIMMSVAGVGQRESGTIY
jgi:predicted phage terminase large subunit-like protein